MLWDRQPRMAGYSALQHAVLLQTAHYYANATEQMSPPSTLFHGLMKRAYCLPKYLKYLMADRVLRYRSYRTDLISSSPLSV